MHNRFHQHRVAGAVVAGLCVGIFGLANPAHAQDAAPPASASPTAAPASPEAALIEKGKYLATAGDCISCHTRPGGDEFAGGLPLKTPFGTIYTANITSDKDAGIGGWTEDQLKRAMREGIADDGDHLYPAFPYTAYT